VNIIPLSEAFYPQVTEIYQQGIDGGDATFQTCVTSWSQWDQATAEAGRLLALEGDRVLGWACLSDATSRCVSCGVAETSVYVANRAQGRGVGSALLKALVEASEAGGYWTLQARIFPENKASIALHHKVGFVTLGFHRKLGRLKGVWRDVVLLERRSARVGLD